MLLSVITVVLNCADTIERTIKSVVEQDFDDVEYIIIDGGSTDGTLDIIKKYNDKIACWISEPDKGIYDAMNKGIIMAKGEWIAFVNANDWYEKGVFKAFSEIARQNCSDIIYGKVNKIQDGEKCGYIGIFQETDSEEIHAGNLYCHQGLFMKRTLFDIIGLFDCGYRILADYDWILKAHNIGIIPEFWDLEVANFTMGGLSCSDASREECRIIICKNFMFHEHPKGVMRKVGKRAFDYFYKNNSSIIFSELVKTCKRVYVWGTGLYGKMFFDVLSELECEILGFVDSNASSELHLGRKVYLPQELLNGKELCQDAEGLICVATEQYETEIIDNLCEYNVSADKYITISQFFDVAVNEYIRLV